MRILKGGTRVEGKVGGAENRKTWYEYMEWCVYVFVNKTPPSSSDVNVLCVEIVL